LYGVISRVAARGIAERRHAAGIFMAGPLGTNFNFGFLTKLLRAWHGGAGLGWAGFMNTWFSSRNSLH
jgi:hypothetical protein